MSLKGGKAGGEDGIIPEFFINGIDLFIHILTRLFNRLFNTGEFPAQWNYATIVTIYKKGDVNDPGNYRGISLLDICGKIYTSVLTRRITFYVNAYAKIKEPQSGFREGYSTTDNAFILQSIISKQMSRPGGRLYVAYVDFMKCFDLIRRDKLWSVCINNGFSGKLLQDRKSVV